MGKKQKKTTEELLVQIHSTCGKDAREFLKAQIQKTVRQL